MGLGMWWVQDDLRDGVGEDRAEEEGDGEERGRGGGRMWEIHLGVRSIKSIDCVYSVATWRHEE